MWSARKKTNSVVIARPSLIERESISLQDYALGGRTEFSWRSRLSKAGLPWFTIYRLCLDI